MADYAETKRRLDAISPSFCVAKWLQVTLHLHNGQTHSCHHPDTHLVPLDELAKDPSALHNTEFKMQQRKLMLEGKRPDECHYCWAAEDSPGKHYSDRVIKSSDPWAEEELEAISNRPFNLPVNPRYLEVSFSQSCNFKCSYCYPNISSSILKEVQKFGRYKIDNNRHDLDYLEKNGLLPIAEEEKNPYIKAFWAWWPALYPDLKVLRLTGGEPLLSANTFRLLDHIALAPNPLLELAINTNLGAPKPLLDRLIGKISEIQNKKSVRKVGIYTSLDAWGKKAEYIRNGLKFDAFIKNFNRITKELPQVDLTIMCTFSNLSLPGVEEFLKGVVKLKKQGKKLKRPGEILLDVSHLVFPLHQSVLLLPKEEGATVLLRALDYMESQPEFSEYEKNKFRRLLHYFQSNRASRPVVNQAEFFRFFAEHDKRRGTKFLRAFPELKEFYEECRKQALMSYMNRSP